MGQGERNLYHYTYKHLRMYIWWEFIYLAFPRMPGESYRRRLGSLLLLCLCDIVRALINSLVCWFRNYESLIPGRWRNIHNLLHTVFWSTAYKEEQRTLDSRRFSRGRTLKSFCFLFFWYPAAGSYGRELELENFILEGLYLRFGQSLSTTTSPC